MKLLICATMIVAPLVANAPIVIAQEDQLPSIGEMENMVLSHRDCKKNSADVAGLAANLKDQFSILSCSDLSKGPYEIIIAPRVPEAPGGLAAYTSQPGNKLLRARFVDHFLVLEYETQKHYLDLLKPNPGSVFVRVGFVDTSASVPQIEAFEETGIFLDSLKNYAGIDGKSELAAKLPALVKQTAGDKPYHLNLVNYKGTWYVSIRVDGKAQWIWPEHKP